jgi:hypothetical protein
MDSASEQRNPGTKVLFITTADFDLDIVHEKVAGTTITKVDPSASTKVDTPNESMPLEQS